MNNSIFNSKRSREEILLLIKEDQEARKLFQSFPAEHQEELICFMQGTQGLPILYDRFFKHIIDPISHPKRLCSFLSALFGEPVTIVEVLAKEGSLLVESGSLVILDIVVQLSDGRYVDVEMQKQGYYFPGERSSCYISDLIMRQYNRIKAERKKKFTFRDMKPVYLIILMENSSPEFLKVAPNYIHRCQYTFDSGANVTLLSNLVYISLDTFRSSVHNITSSTDAWLTFLSSDKPEDILRLIDAYPEFEEYYRDILKFQTKPKELFTMFSDAFIEMDRNTVQYMIEEQQKEIEENQKVIEESQKVIEESQKVIEESQKVIENDQRIIAEKDALIAKLQAQLAETNCK